MTDNLDCTAYTHATYSGGGSERWFEDALHWDDLLSRMSVFDPAFEHIANARNRALNTAARLEREEQAV